MGITNKELLETFEYEPTTGNFIWKKHWRSTHIGRRAGTDCKDRTTLAVNKRRIYAHRAAWQLFRGPIPKGMVIDHINHNPHDNRLENLRLILWGENQRNMSRSKANTSGVVGVDRYPNGKWRAKITLNYRTVHIGYFDTFDEAVAARKKAENENGFHPNHGRVVELEAA